MASLNFKLGILSFILSLNFTVRNLTIFSGHFYVQIIFLSWIKVFNIMCSILNNRDRDSLHKSAVILGFCDTNMLCIGVWEVLLITHTPGSPSTTNQSSRQFFNRRIPQREGIVMLTIFFISFYTLKNMCKKEKVICKTSWDLKAVEL